MKKEAEFELTINVSIRHRNHGGAGLEVRESVFLNADSFMQLATVLARFHELAKELGDA